MFWKKAYERCEDEKIQLENKVFVLEQQLDLKNEASSMSISLGNRKRRPSETLRQNAKANTQTKRRKVDTPDNTGSLEIEAILELCKNPSGMSMNDHINLLTAQYLTEYQTLLRTFHKLRKAILDPNGTPQMLSCAVSSGCHAIIHCVRNISRDCAKRKFSISGQPKLPEIFRAITNLWNSMLTAIVEIQQRSSTNTEPRCIADIILLFQSMLGSIHQCSLDRADEQEKLCQAKKGSLTSERLFVHENVCKLIVGILCKILDGLKSSDGLCRKIVEGAMSVLLDHIGSSLSLLVFAEPRTEKRPFLGLLPPRGLVDVEHIENSTAMLTCRLSAPFIVCMLRKALETAEDVWLPDHLRTTCSNNSSSNWLSISLDLKNRLQDTLLRGIYGDDDVSVVHPFDRAESSALPPINELEALLSNSQDDPNWLVGQVWECLGWDILAENVHQGKLTR